MEGKKLEDMEHEHDKPEVPDLICIDPTQKMTVLQAFANFNQELKGQVLAHLDLCLHCRELAGSMLASYRSSARLTTNALRAKAQHGRCTNVVMAEVRLRTEARPRSN